MGFSRQEHQSGLPCHSPGYLHNPGVKPRSPTLQADSLPSEPPGKPKNTGMGSLSFLQEIFLTQELNWGLLHCWWILHQLSYQRSPSVFLKLFLPGVPDSASRLGTISSGTWSLASSLPPWSKHVVDTQKKYLLLERLYE